MDMATHRFGLRPNAAFSLIFTLATVVTVAASGQEGSGGVEEKSLETEISEVVADLRVQRTEIDELASKIENSSERAAEIIMAGELSERREEYRRDVKRLVKLVLEGEEDGTDVQVGKQTATEILEDEAPKIKESILDKRKKLVGLVETAATGSPEASAEARQKMAPEVEASSRLVKYMQANIENRQALGLDVQNDVEWMKDYLKDRADGTSGMLKKTKQQIDEISSRPGVDEDPEALKEVAAWRKQRDALADSQRINADIMDSYGMETSQFRRGIITSTGKLSEDILDAKVATGLAESLFDDAGNWVRTNGAQLVFQIVTLLLILFAFWVAARIARGAVRRGLERSQLDVSSLAKEFFVKSTGRLIMLVGFIIAVAQVGVEVGPLLAGLGIAGFVVGFALQDTLSNFASGMMILVYRPFDVGDVIEAGGVTGKVDQMNLVSTMILTFDNQLLIVPNKQVWGGIIRNVTSKDKRRIDMTFGIGYSDDIPKAEKILTEIITAHEKVLGDPEPVVRLHTLGESSVDFIARPWSKTEDYWDVYWDVTREVKRRFDEEGISIPFPQRDVHIFHENGNGNDDSSVERKQRSATDKTARDPAPGDEGDDD